MNHMKFVIADDYFQADGVPQTMKLNHSRNVFRSMIQDGFMVGYIRVKSIDVKVIKKSIEHHLYLHITITGHAFEVMVVAKDMTLVNAILNHSNSSIAKRHVNTYFRDIYREAA